MISKLVDFALHNRFDRAVFGSSSARFGILTAGKAYADVRYALTLLQVDESRAKSLGLDIYKVGMIWPLEPSGLPIPVVLVALEVATAWFYRDAFAPMLHARTEPAHKPSTVTNRGTVAA